MNSFEMLIQDMQIPTKWLTEKGMGLWSTRGARSCHSDETLKKYVVNCAISGNVMTQLLSLLALEILIQVQQLLVLLESGGSIFCISLFYLVSLIL